MLCSQHAADGFRGGVEYGFMSCTSKREVATEYARGGRGLIFEIYMGMVDKGADLQWLSQYACRRSSRPPL